MFDNVDNQLDAVITVY